MDDRLEVAKRLAQIHYESESTTHVYVYCVGGVAGVPDEPDEPIKLLEVNQDTIASGIVPLHFGPVPERGINYPSTIIEVTPEEYEQIDQGQLRLPNGWEDRELLPPPVRTQDQGE